jgi:hypothetical protein
MKLPAVESALGKVQARFDLAPPRREMRALFHPREARSQARPDLAKEAVTGGGCRGKAVSTTGNRF